MKFLFIFLGVAYLLLFLIRWLLSFIYYKKASLILQTSQKSFLQWSNPSSLGILV